MMSSAEWNPKTASAWYEAWVPAFEQTSVQTNNITYMYLKPTHSSETVI